MQVTVARQLYVAKNEARQAGRAEATGRIHQRTIASARRPDAQPRNAGSHVLAYADKQGRDEENAPTARPMVAAMLEALQRAGVDCIADHCRRPRPACAGFAPRSCRPLPSNARPRSAMADVLKPCDGKEVEENVALGAGQRQGAGSGGAGRQARHRPPAQVRHHARPVGLHRRHALRAGRAGADGAAGTPLAEIEALLDERNQQLAFEPAIRAAARRRRRHGRVNSATPSAASSPATSPGRGGSRRARRATTCWASTRSAAAARPSSRAAGWSRTSPASTSRS